MGPVLIANPARHPRHPLPIAGLTILLTAEAKNTLAPALDSEPGATPASLGLELGVLLSPPLLPGILHLASTTGLLILRWSYVKSLDINAITKHVASMLRIRPSQCAWRRAA